MHCTVWSDSSSVDLSPSIHLRLVDPGVYRAAFQIHWVLLLSSLILLLFSSLFVFFFFFLFLFSPFLSSLLKKILRIPKSGPPVFTLLPQPRFSISRSTSFRGFELAWSEGELLSVLSFIHFSVALFVVTGVFFSLLAFFFFLSSSYPPFSPPSFFFPRSKTSTVAILQSIWAHLCFFPLYITDGKAYLTQLSQFDSLDRV